MANFETDKFVIHHILRNLKEIKQGRDAGTTKKRRSSRAYNGAKVSELLADWNVGQTSADSETKGALTRGRSRARDLERNNDYVNKYLYLNEANVIGAHGIRLVSKVKTSSGKNDKRANDLLEDSWRRWGEKGICTADGQYSWLGAQRQIARAVPRDGEMLVRVLRGVDNPWGFAIQLLEPDHLDTDLDNVQLSNGNVIRMGVELNSFRRPVAYHIKAEHPGDYAFFAGGRQTARIPATEMKLIFLPMRAESTRGFPWINTAMVRLKMIGAYDEAEVVAARYGAAKMGIITKDPQASAQYEGDDKDAIGNPIQDIAPGVIEEMPIGHDFKLLDPTHPSKNYGEFNKAALRGVASGLNVSYVSLANNLEGVNFSSIRQGVLDERDQWRMIQAFYAEFWKWIYLEWLKMAMLTDLAGSLTPSKFVQYTNHAWQPRGWQWIDPKKDAEGKVIEINNLMTSHTQVARDRGLDFEDIVAQQANDKALVEAAGLTWEQATTAVVNAPLPDDKDEDDEEGDDDAG